MVSVSSMFLKVVKKSTDLGILCLVNLTETRVTLSISG